MAEPVGITGTAAGLVSLGLQLYSEISNYLDAVKGRQQDLDFAKYQCTNLKRCIDAIGAAITSPGSVPALSIDALGSSVQSCQRELGALNELVLRLQGPSLPPRTVSAKLRETGRKLTFPFHREGLQELEKRLESTINVLQLATQTLGLDALLAAHVDLDKTRSALDDVRTGTEDARTKIESLSENMERMRISTNQSNRILPAIEERTTTTAVLMGRQAETLSRVEHQVCKRVDDSAHSILGGVSKVDTRLRNVEEILADITRQVSSQPNVVAIECELVGAASPINMQTTPNILLGSTSSTENMAKYGAMSKTGLPASMHGTGNEKVLTSLCTCVEYRIQNHRQIRWGPVTLRSKCRANIQHSSKCLMGRIIEDRYQRSHGFELTIPALQSLTGKVIHVFWSFTSGTGGIGLERELSVTNMVSSESSTSFRLLHFVRMLWEDRMYIKNHHWRLLGATWRRLVWCYSNGKASPTDVNENGHTLLYSILHKMGHGIMQHANDWSEIAQQATWLVYALQLLHIPPISTYARGSHPVALAIVGDWPVETGLAYQHEAMRQLESHDVDVNNQHQLWLRGNLPSHRGILKDMSTATAEALGSSDLQIFIIRQDRKGVSHILQNNPSSIRDRNCFGQNSAHAAVVVGNLKILQMILSHADALALNAPDYTKPRGRYPIEYAVMPELHPDCHISDGIPCNGCDILDAMLRSDCAMYPSFFFATFSGHTTMSGEVTECSLKQVILHLKERRQKLREYAKKYLLPTQAAEFGLYGENVLDVAAGDVQTALQERSIFVPVPLRVYDTESESWEDLNFRSIHSYLSCSNTASYAWELGFRDLGVDSAIGFYDLWKHLLDNSIIEDDSRRSRAVSHTQWLLERGADLGKSLPCPIQGKINFASWTAAHLLTAYLARCSLSKPIEITLLLRDEVACAATSISIVDGCRCACALNGCSPLLLLLDGTTVWERQVWKRQPSPTLVDYKHHLRWFCDFWATITESHTWQGSSKPTAVINLILRYLTFTALDLRHSCCRVAQWNGIQDWDSEEVEEVIGEQEGEILLLDTLLEELEQDYMDSPDLDTFIDGYWGPKTSTAISELNARKLDEGDLRAAEAIGVDWHCFETDPAEKDDLRLTKLEYWMEELNAIAPEPGPDVPLAPYLPVFEAFPDV